ncbi:MAG: hypothetical protein HRU35_07960 [Rickettsiaceae bacterium]|nr:hypothetical protein [Rickettsiaceae bacterium]
MVTDIKKLHSLLDNFNKKYITNLFTHEKSSIKQISLTAINTLSQEKDLLDLLNTLQQQNLIDAVKIHTSHNKLNEYPSNIHNILSLLETTLKNKSDTISQEKQHLVKMACNIIQAIQEIYSLSDDKNQLQLLENHLALLQSTNIAFNIPNLNLELQLNLIDNLLMIKELWFIKQDHHIFKKDIRVKLNQDTNNTIKLKDYENIAVIFTKIINVLSNEDNILEELTNTEIINLYGKLKNVVSISQTEIIILLNKLHLEAKTLYNCNKLDDSGYGSLQK